MFLIKGRTGGSVGDRVQGRQVSTKGEEGRVRKEGGGRKEGWKEGRKRRKGER